MRSVAYISLVARSRANIVHHNDDGIQSGHLCTGIGGILRTYRSQHCLLEAGSRVARLVPGVEGYSRSRNDSYDSLSKPNKMILTYGV